MPKNRTVVVASRGAIAEAFRRWTMDLEGLPEETAPRGAEESIEEYSLRQADYLLGYLADAEDDGSPQVCFPRVKGITTSAAVAEVDQAAAAVPAEETTENTEDTEKKQAEQEQPAVSPETA